MLIYLFCENCNPPEKSHPPLSQELLFKILSKVQPPPQQKGGGGGGTQSTVSHRSDSSSEVNSSCCHRSDA